MTLSRATPSLFKSSKEIDQPNLKLLKYLEADIKTNYRKIDDIKFQNSKRQLEKDLKENGCPQCNELKSNKRKKARQELVNSRKVNKEDLPMNSRNYHKTMLLTDEDHLDEWESEVKDVKDRKQIKESKVWQKDNVEPKDSAILKKMLTDKWGDKFPTLNREEKNFQQNEK